MRSSLKILFYLRNLSISMTQTGDYLYIDAYTLYKIFKG